MRLPKNRAPSHPGMVLKEVYLDDMNLTQVDLAKKIGCRVVKINEIVNGKRGITPEFAIDLGEALGTGAELWANLQCQYELWNAYQKRKKAS